MGTRKSRSSIEKHGLQEFVGHLFESGATYEQIKEKVQKAKRLRVTTSSLSRYHTNWASAEEQIRLAKQDYDTVQKIMQANPETDFAEAAIQIVLSKMMRRLANANEAFENLPLDKLSWLLAKLARVKQGGQALGIQEKRLELLARRVKDVARDVAETVKKGGLSDAAVLKIKQKILGVVPA